ncbi:Chemotaxis protein methyltransferase Cher2 [Polystyrenella longa]|uniref:Chemotaxis protein methyltransferase Cher2 n=1 Tax=Polystyrenella longa TaxID=2528007 RepID=A0A518CNX6_9PLAN|nr:protein-glutamate O-methyltransferase CheR [Polystyrenella longa]QDU80927.1 Chemotaxis protein methyltransferase Cher2 [Polystyrenella longa]
MDPVHYDYLASFLLGASGLSLGNNKEYLLESRLIPLAQSMGWNGIPELITQLRLGRDKNLEDAVVEAMTTNETSFFRDKKPFEVMTSHIFPELVKSRATRRTIRIWCAAGATGQEPYSIAMTILENFPELRNWHIEMLITDISQQALGRSKEGVYSQFEIQRGLPVKLLMKHFEQNDKGWKVKEDLKKGMRWERFNLLDSYNRFGVFDLIMCRNVLIYFENKTKGDILDRMSKQLASDGYLMLGSAETILGITESYQKIPGLESGVYETIQGKVGATR